MEMTITVSKQDLLAKMRENRDKHHQVFIDSLAGYQKAALDALEEHVTALKDGRTPDIRIILDRPVDHTREYDRVIGMLVMDKGEEFTLDEETYAQYVDDDWRWKRQWLRKMSDYAEMSTSAAYGVAAVEEARDS